MFDTLPFKKRLTKEHMTGVMPISHQELACEAYKLGFSTLETQPRSLVFKERAFQYVSVELLVLISKTFTPLDKKEESDLKKQWAVFFEKNLDSPQSHETMQAFWHFVNSSRGMSHVLSLHTSEKDWANWSSKLHYIKRECDEPHQISSLLIAFISKSLVPRLQNQLQKENEDFFKNPAVIAYQQPSLVSKKTDGTFEAPAWLALVTQTIDPLYRVKRIPHVSTEVFEDAADRIQSQFMQSHNLDFDHFVRIIQSLSEPSIALTTYDQVQINSFLQKNSPVECSMEQLSASQYDTNILLSYLEQYGFFIDFKENTSFLYSWLSRPAHQKIIEKVEDWRDRALEQAEDSLVDMVPKMLNKGGAKFIKYLPAIATAAITIIALLGHKKKEHLAKWTADLDEQKMKAIQKNLGLREFVSYHFSSFIVACAKFSIENGEELPHALREYESLLFSRRIQNNYQLILSSAQDLHHTQQPSWDQIRQSSKLPIAWLQWLTRHLEDPITWAMSQIRLLTVTDQAQQTPIDTKAQLKTALEQLDQEATKHAKTIIRLWKSKVMHTGVLIPCLDLPHMTLAHQDILTENLGSLLQSHPHAHSYLDRSLLKILRSSKRLFHDLPPETFSPHSIAHQLSQRRLSEWPEHFSRYPEHWEACAKALSLEQWKGLIEAFKTLSLRQHVPFDRLFDRLLILEKRERAWPNSDPQLHQKICCFPFPTGYSISNQIELFEQLLRDQHYALLDLFVRNLDDIDRFDHKSFWYTLCHHGQWSLAQLWKQKTRLVLSEKEEWLFALQSKTQYALIRNKNFFFTQGSFHEKKSYFIYAIEMGSLELLAECLTDTALRDYLSNERNYFIYQNHIDKSYRKKINSQKDLKLSLFLFEQLSVSFSEEKKRDYIILYMARAFAKKSPISLIHKIANLADRYGVFYRSPHYSRYFVRSKLLEPLDIVMTCLPFIHPQSRTIASQYVQYMASRYDQRHYQQHMTRYLEKARHYWPVSRIESKRFYKEKISPDLYQHMQNNRMAWIRWAKTHNCPWLLKEILQNKPYSFHSFEITGSWPITAKALLSWMFCNHYGDIFKDWICAQAWSRKKWLQITLYALDRGFRDLAIEAAQHCDCHNEEVAGLLREQILSTKRHAIAFSKQNLLEQIETIAQHPPAGCVPFSNLSL